MRAELETAGLGSLADWLTRDVPAAILEDSDVPPRPLDDRAMSEIGRPGARRGRWWRRQQ